MIRSFDHRSGLSSFFDLFIISVVVLLTKVAVFKVLSWISSSKNLLSSLKFPSCPTQVLDPWSSAENSVSGSCQSLDSNSDR